MRSGKSEAKSIASQADSGRSGFPRIGSIVIGDSDACARDPAGSVKRQASDWPAPPVGRHCRTFSQPVPPPLHQLAAAVEDPGDVPGFRTPYTAPPRRDGVRRGQVSWRSWSPGVIPG